MFKQLQRPYSIAGMEKDGIPKLLAGIETHEQWHQKIAEVRHLWLEHLGELPERPSLQVQEVLEERLCDHVRKKVIINTVYGDDIPAYLLIPLELPSDRPVPGVLALHPTNGEGKNSVATPEGKVNRMYALELVRLGYVVLAPDAMTSGERIFAGQEFFNSSRFYEKHPEWSTVAKNLVDHMQALDYLTSLSCVNGEQIGVIGHSFGAYNAYFLAGVDSRVKALVASCGVAPFTQSDYPTHWGKREFYYTHIPSLTEAIEKRCVPFEFNEVIALAAPCPMLLYSAQRDDIFTNWQAIADLFYDLGELYRFLGAEDSLLTLLGNGTHDFPPLVRKLAYDFLARELGAAEANRPT